MMNTAAKRRKVYKEAFCNHPDNEGAIKMADLLYGDYYPKRNKEKAFLDALEGVGFAARMAIEQRVRAGRKNLYIATAFSWANSNQGDAFWRFLHYRVAELGKTYYV